MTCLPWYLPWRSECCRHVVTLDEVLPDGTEVYRCIDCHLSPLDGYGQPLTVVSR